MQYCLHVFPLADLVNWLREPVFIKTSWAPSLPPAAMAMMRPAVVAAQQTHD